MWSRPLQKHCIRLLLIYETKKVMTVIPWGPWLSNMLKIMVMAGAFLDVLLLF